MSYSTWHNYGYGICVDDINTQNVERLRALLELAPEFKAKIEDWLSELDIKEPSWDDYMEFDQDYCLGLATILKEVIAEAEGIDLTACDNYDSIACYNGDSPEKAGPALFSGSYPSYNGREPD